MSDKADKKLMGVIYPFIILGYIGGIYYGIVVRLYWMMKSSRCSSSPLVRHHSIGRLPPAAGDDLLGVPVFDVRGSGQASELLGTSS